MVEGSHSPSKGHTHIDSANFDAKQYFRNYIKDKSVEQVIKKNNEIFLGKFLKIIEKKSGISILNSKH